MKLLAIAPPPNSDIILLGTQWLAISKARVTMSLTLRLGVTFGMHEEQETKNTTLGPVVEQTHMRTHAHKDERDNRGERRTGVTSLNQATLG